MFSGIFRDRYIVIPLIPVLYNIGPHYIHEPIDIPFCEI